MLVVTKQKNAAVAQAKRHFRRLCAACLKNMLSGTTLADKWLLAESESCIFLANGSSCI